MTGTRNLVVPAALPAHSVSICRPALLLHCAGRAAGATDMVARGHVSRVTGTRLGVALRRHGGRRYRDR